MFEELEKEERGEKEESKKLLRITALILSVLVVVGAVLYLRSTRHPKAAPPVPHLAAAPQTAPDPVHDLKIVRARMGRDPTGIRVVWAVQLQNKSTVYTYSDITYEARFIGPDGRMKTANRDIIKDSIAPGEDKRIPQFVDGIYDSHASTYQFVLISAKAEARQGG